MSETWTGTIEAIVAPDARPRDRYARRLLFCGAPLAPVDAVAPMAEDDDDSGSEALEVAHETIGRAAPRSRGALPPRRVLVDARDAIPLAHAGARVSLLLERTTDADQLPVYRAARCVGFEPARNAASAAALRRAVADPFALMAVRDAVRADRAADKSQRATRGAAKVRGGVPLGAAQSAALRAVGAPHQLGALLAPLERSARDTFALQRALEFAYCAADAGTLLGVDEQTLARSLSALLRGPCGARGALLEQLSARRVLELARALGTCLRTADDGAALADALVLPAARDATLECAADVLAHRWRAMGTPATGLRPAHVKRLARAAPAGESAAFVLRAAERAAELGRATAFGDTLVECDTDAADDDDADSSDDESLPLGAEPAGGGGGGTSPVGWLCARDYVRRAPEPGCVWLRADATRAADIAARVKTQFARTTLLDTGPFLLAHRPERLAAALLVPRGRTLLVAPSAVYAQRLGGALVYDAAVCSAERVSRAALLAGRAPLLGAYCRVALLDAHEWCEHDLAHTLAALAPLAARAPTELLLAGGAYGAPAPRAHRGAGAPFADLWHAAPGAVLEPPRCAAPGAPACAARTEASRCVAHCAAALLADAPLDGADALLAGTAHWHVVGPLAALGRVCDALAAAVDDAAPPLADALRRVGAHPFLARHTLFLAAAPFVRSGAALVRVARAFDVVRQERRLERIGAAKHLRELEPAKHGPTVSLDAPGLYLELATSDGRDHRRCCFTDSARLLCVARHRAELAAASFAPARDALATHLVAPCAALAFVPAADDAAAQAGALDLRGADGAVLRALLLRQPFERAGGDWSVRVALPLGPADAGELAPQLERRLAYTHRSPRTGLRCLLQTRSADADDAPEFDYDSE